VSHVLKKNILYLYSGLVGLAKEIIGDHQYEGKGKVHPCKALRLCTGRTAQRGSRGIALLFLDHGTRKR